MPLKPVDKYLKNYAEVETLSLASFPKQHTFTHVVVIPAFKEETGFIEHFLSSRASLPLLENKDKVLMIIVINQPDVISDTSAQQHLFNEIKQLAELDWQENNLFLFSPLPSASPSASPSPSPSFKESNTKLLVVDRFTKAIPEKQGVGLARKIGADLALTLIEKNCISSPWIFSTDADVSLPDNYFSSLDIKNSKTVAACFNFIHQSDDKAVEKANLQYEQALRYYVAGLTYAGSHYAFFTIGSTLAFQAEAYAKVRGFPKRSAGEDFYLLNKIAKLGEVSFIKNCQITIQARTSDRVPFGTGPAVSQIMALAENNQAYCYYQPKLFNLLKSCLVEFNHLWQERNNLSLWYSRLNNDAVLALKAIGFESFVDKHSNHKELQFNKQLSVWFDAFKTLKFIHALRDLNYPNIPLASALEQAEFKSQ